MSLVKGREFEATDRADSARVVIVNELFAHKYYPHQDAIGKRLRLNGADGPFAEIVGVAKQGKYVFPVEPPMEYLYLPLAQNPAAAMTLLLETEGPSAGLTGPLRDLVRSLDSRQPIYGVRTMEEFFDVRAHKTLGLFVEAMAGLGDSRTGAGVGGALWVDDLFRELAATRNWDPHGGWGGPCHRGQDGAQARDDFGRQWSRHRPGPESCRG